MKQFFATVIAAVAVAPAMMAIDIPVAPAAPILPADESGKTRVAIRAIVPDKDINGNTLTYLRSVTIYRDGRPVSGGQEPCGWYDQECEPGTTTTVFYDSAVYGLTPGTHTYYLKATNEAGESAEGEHATVFVGIPRPTAPTDAKATTTSNEGEVTITWNAPAKDANGNTINPSIISYRIDDISNGEAVKVTEVEAATTYTYQAVQAGVEQQMKQYRITAFTTTGESRNSAETMPVPVGKPLSMPYTDSFDGDTHSYAFVTTGGDGQFAIYNVHNTHFPAYDGDGAVAAFTGVAEGDMAMMNTCEIEIGDNAVLTYMVSAEENSTNKLALFINDILETETDLSNSGSKWIMEQIDMTRFAGKKVSLSFRASYGNTEAVVIDNIRVETRTPSHDVKPVTDLKAATDDATTNVTLTWSKPDDSADNTGYNIYCDGERVNAEPVAETTFTHNDVTGGTHKYHATVCGAQGIESVPSNVETVTISSSSIDTVAADGTIVATIRGAVEVTAAEGTQVEVSTAEGRVIYDGASKGSKLTVAVPAGIVIVRAGQSTFKVIVR